MAGHIDHIIHAAHDPVVAIFIFACAITGEVHRGNLRPVLFHIAVGVAIDGPQHPWPWLLQYQKSTGTLRNRLAIHGDNLRHNSWEWLRRRTWFRRNRAWNRRDHDVPGFSLPPGINNRAAIMANHFAIPHL